MSEETLTDLDERIGPDFRSLPEAARLALATALQEGEVTNDRLKTVTGLHRTDLTVLLRDLTRHGFLFPSGRGRGTHYHLVDTQEILHPLDVEDPMAQTGEDSQHNGEHKDAKELTSAEWDALMAQAAMFRERERAASSDQVRGLILELARDHFLSLRQLSLVLDRTEGTLQNHYIRKMNASGELELKFPEPNHPQQAYRARKRP
jgi:hypothetical protein